jgi:adenosylhomocysteine nucleosidase
LKGDIVVAFSKIGIIGAMDEEIELLLKRLTSVETMDRAGIQYYEGFFLEKRVVLCKSGVGKVNAAVCTQILIDRFGVDAIIFTGVAGALHPSLDIGDVVISTECMQHDMDVSALGFDRGTIPFAEKSIFQADPQLLQFAYEASEQLFAGRTMKGRILSGDQFIANRETVQQLYEQMGGACTEMEGAAVAQVCSMNSVPFIVIRSMSDRADGSAHVNFAEFTVLASKNSYEMVEAIIRKL